ncbi:SDR family NAD(P)-dependent oxidoreductase [Streptomyces sp. A7024]|uniref:SDR family NAD(P)-dependent oxidoreductase n=1 Tax=Streptomyces coryli TaxID=1128680 RepID=A0A6G4TZU8_9ACTN|nr:SDR family oxidoreductase [Streptomyces coryli]NGN65040.1 SDR family NAD(P)-dependent oxidoreductase [Streptomyces coryli]
MSEEKVLAGKVALVAGATRGAGRAMAVALGAKGATVYATGRTTRTQVSEVGRKTETIEETAELVTAAGGEGIAVPTDHLEREQVKALLDRIERERGRLDVLVNDLWGGEHLVEFGKKMWEIDLERGLRMLELGVKSHIITSWYALPLLVRTGDALLVEITDGTAESNQPYREMFFYDLAKNAPIRMAFNIGHELKESGGTAVAVSPGFLRSEQMLDTFKTTEETWRDSVGKTAPKEFALSESPYLVARGVAELAADQGRARWNGESLYSGQLAKEYGYTDTDGTLPDSWPYFSRLMRGEDPGDPESYRSRP